MASDLYRQYVTCQFFYFGKLAGEVPCLSSLTYGIFCVLLPRLAVVVARTNSYFTINLYPYPSASYRHLNFLLTI